MDRYKIINKLLNENEDNQLYTPVQPDEKSDFIESPINENKKEDSLMKYYVKPDTELFHHLLKRDEAKNKKSDFIESSINKKDDSLMKYYVKPGTELFDYLLKRDEAKNKKSDVVENFINENKKEELPSVDDSNQEIIQPKFSLKEPIVQEMLSKKENKESETTPLPTTKTTEENKESEKSPLPTTKTSEEDEEKKNQLLNKLLKLELLKKSKNIDYTDLLHKATKASNIIDFIAGLGKGAQMIGESIATGGAGTKIETDKSGWDDIRKTSSKPLEHVSNLAKIEAAQKELETIREMNDPNSAISKLSVEIAKKQIEKYNPKLADQLTGLTAAQLDKLGLKNFVTTASKTFQQGQAYYDEKGDVRFSVFDPNTGQYIDAVSRQPISTSVKGFASKTFVNPQTGEVDVFNPALGTRLPLTGPSNIIQQPTTTTKTTQETLIKSDKEQPKKAEEYVNEEIKSMPQDFFNPYKTTQPLNVKQREDLNKASEKFLTLNKETLDAFYKLPNLEKQIQLARENPIAWSQVGAQVAKLYEGGRLTDEDVKRYVTRKDLVGKVRQTINDLLEGKITKDNAKYLSEALDVFNKSNEYKLNQMALKMAKQSKELYNINVPAYQLAGKIFGDFKLPDDVKTVLEFIHDNYNSNDPKIQDKIFKAQKKLYKEGYL